MPRAHRFRLAIVFVLLGAAPAAPSALSHAAELTVSSAIYGVAGEDGDRAPRSGKSFTVTEKVAKQIRDGVLRLEVSNDLFGDPAPHEGKVLLVEWVLDGQRGRSRVDEGDMLVIPAPVLSGPLAIRSAVYGDFATGQISDVTATVRARLADDAIEMKVTNDALGDPAPGTFKVLRVEYSIGDEVLVRRVYEDGTLRLESPDRRPRTNTPAPR